jgi:hypothetical protein
MDESFYTEQFELRALSPTVWVLTARRLKRCADIIFNKYKIDLAALESGASPLDLQNLELSGCATLLQGFAFENLLKAIVIQAQPTVIVGGRLRKWSADGHDLLALCAEASLDISEAERDLFARLTAFVRWAGRYPIPKSVQDMKLSQAAGPTGWVPLPLNSVELVEIDTLYERLETMVIQE